MPSLGSLRKCAGGVLCSVRYFEALYFFFFSKHSFWEVVNCCQCHGCFICLGRDVRKGDEKQGGKVSRLLTLKEY